MRLPRIMEMTVFLVLAVVVLLPRPDAKVKPALRLGDAERGRMAELQATLLVRPGDPGAALELADLLLDGKRADFALAALAPAIERHPADHRVHARRSLALADHFEAAPAFAAAERALTLCQTGSEVPCTDAEQARLTLLRSSLERIRDVDMRKDPNTAKEQLLKGLRPASIPRPRPPGREGANTP